MVVKAHWIDADVAKQEGEGKGLGFPGRGAVVITDPVGPTTQHGIEPGQWGPAPAGSMVLALLKSLLQPQHPRGLMVMGCSIARL